MALEARVVPYGTIIFIALILVVACSLLYWLSALCGTTRTRSGTERRSRSIHFPTGNKLDAATTYAR
jgi:hypothetical protein